MSEMPIYKSDLKKKKRKEFDELFPKTSSHIPIAILTDDTDYLIKCLEKD